MQKQKLVKGIAIGFAVIVVALLVVHLGGAFMGMLSSHLSGMGK